MVYAAVNIKADEAYRIGLVNGVFTKEELMPTAMKLAKKIASNAPIAVRNSKESLTDGYLSDLGPGNLHRGEIFLRSASRPRTRRRGGMKAFLEKGKVDGFKTNKWNCSV